MKKLLYTLLLLWYFGVRGPYDPVGFPKVTISSVIGPFQTQLECNRERTNIRALLKSIGDADSLITECKEMTNA